MRRDGQKRGTGRGRYFLALFDYDPATMSPNPDGVNEELPFKEGQIIKVHGSKDADGFYMGELSNGLRGLVPSNMISEIEDPSNVPGRRFVGSNTLPHQSSVHKYGGRHQSFDYPGQQGYQGAPRQMVAIQNFDPIIHPPNRDIEPGLPLRTGELIMVHGAVDCNGYYRGEKNGAFGLVPADFLRDVTPNEYAQQQQQQHQHKIHHQLQQQQQHSMTSNQIRSRHESYSSAMGHIPAGYQRDAFNQPVVANHNPSFGPRNENFMTSQNQTLQNATATTNVSNYEPFKQPLSSGQTAFTHHPQFVGQQQQNQPHQQFQQYSQQSHQQIQHHTQQFQSQHSLQQNQHPGSQVSQNIPQQPQHLQQQRPMYLPQQHQPQQQQMQHQAQQLPQPQHFQQNLQQPAPPQRFQQQFPQQQPPQSQQMDHYQMVRNQAPGIRYQQLDNTGKMGDNFHFQQRGRLEFEQRPTYQNPQQLGYQQQLQQQQQPIQMPPQRHQQPQQSFNQQMDQFNR